MSAKLTDFLIAGGIADWLNSNGCVTTIIQNDVTIEVHYTLKLDMKPQPPIRIVDGKISIPKGSQEAVLMAFLKYLTS